MTAEPHSFPSLFDPPIGAAKAKWATAAAGGIYPDKPAKRPALAHHSMELTRATPSDVAIEGSTDRAYPDMRARQPRATETAELDEQDRPRKAPCRGGAGATAERCLRRSGTDRRHGMKLRRMNSGRANCR